MKWFIAPNGPTMALPSSSGLPPHRRGDILPFRTASRYPKSSRGQMCLLLACTMITAATQGYDGAMMGGLNIMDQYTEYFHLSTATRSLLNATLYVGGCLACFCWGWLSDEYGRRVGLFWAALITIVATAIQATSQNIGMFILARMLVGFGTTASAITAPAYLAETLPWNQRAWGLGLFDDFYYVGALAAAGVTYGTAQMDGTMAWRLPSLLQGVWGLACILLLPWMPESPRWLVDQGRAREALAVLAHINAGGDTGDDFVRLQFCEICDTLGFERDPMTWRQMARDRGNVKRLVITATCALFAMLTGNIIIKYEIGRVLEHAGVASEGAQLMINVGLNAGSLCVSIAGSLYVDRLGVKSAALLGTGGMTAALFAIGLLTRQFGESGDMPGIYATVAMIFVFSAFFALGWIPILFLVPAEMLNFRIRAYGMSMFSLVINITGIWGNIAFLFALDTIGWRLYIINGAWNLVFFAFIAWYWVEVRGRTLEEIDVLFDGVKHSDVPNIQDAIRDGVDAKCSAKLRDWMKTRCFVTSDHHPSYQTVTRRE